MRLDLYLLLPMLAGVIVYIAGAVLCLKREPSRIGKVLVIAASVALIAIACLLPKLFAWIAAIFLYFDLLLLPPLPTGEERETERRKRRKVVIVSAAAVLLIALLLVAGEYLLIIWTVAHLKD